MSKHLIFAPSSTEKLLTACYGLRTLISTVDQNATANDLDGEPTLNQNVLGGLLAAAQTCANFLDNEISGAADHPFHCHPEFGAQRLAKIVKEATHA